MYIFTQFEALWGWDFAFSLTYDLSGRILTEPVQCRYQSERRDVCEVEKNNFGASPVDFQFDGNRSRPLNPAAPFSVGR